MAEAERQGRPRIIFVVLTCSLLLLTGCVGGLLSSKPQARIDAQGAVRALETGDPIAGATVVLGGQTTQTDADGTYSLSNVTMTNGRVTYRVSSPGFIERTGNIAAQAGKPLVADFVLPAVAPIGTGTIIGRLNFAEPAHHFDEAFWCEGTIQPSFHPSMMVDPPAPTEVIVDLAAGSPTVHIAEQLAASTGAAGYRISPYINRIILTVPKDTTWDRFIELVRNQPEVLDAYPNETGVVASPMAVEPNDPCFPYQHHLHQVNVPLAWAATTGDRNVVVAVIDSGVNPNHPDLKENLTSGWDFLDDTDSMTDLTGHGTHVSGIIGAVANNHVGVAGIAWDVTIMPVRVTRLVAPSVEAIAAGIAYAVDNGADIINLSLQVTADLPPIREAIEYADVHGVIIVAAAGNYGPGPTQYPANYEPVIGVGSASPWGGSVLSEFSARGEGVQLIAPGEQIWSTNHVSSYVTSSGTSMAAPVVSGVAALMLANGIDPADVPDVLYRTAIRIGDPETNIDDRHTYGWGLVNAYAAVMGVDPAAAVLYVVDEDGDVVSAIGSPDDSRRFEIRSVAEGEALTLVGWIDVNGSGSLDRGDYFGTAPFTMTVDGIETVDLDIDVYD